MRGREEEERGREKNDKHWKETESNEVLSAAEGIKGDIKRISQLGSEPAKKFSVLIKKKQTHIFAIGHGW